MRRKALICVMAGAIGYCAAGALPAGSAPDAGRTFAASAEAEGVRITFEAPEFLVVSTLFDAANPISQATLESTGVSRSFASAPYPGDLIVTAPGTLAAFGGPSLPVQYPFHAAAGHPETPKASVEDPAGNYSLTATAEAARSTAAGRLSVAKGPVTRTEALTETMADGAVRASASSVTEGIVAGDGALTIGRVISRVETISRPGAVEPVVTRHFEITGARAGDTAVEITADGVKAGSGGLPVGDAAKPVQEALAKAGLDVRIEGGDTLAGGGTARTLVIRSTQQAPVPGAPKGVLTLRVGGAATAVLTGAAAVVEVPGTVGTAPDGLSGPGGADLGPAPCDPAAPAGSPAACAGPGMDAFAPGGSGGFGVPGASDAGFPGGSGAAAGTGAAQGSDEGHPVTAGDGTVLAAGPDATQIASVPTALPVRRAVRWIFVVLAAGGALALAGSAAFRRKGVQTTWTL